MTCPIGCFWMGEDSDDEKPLSSKYNSKSKVGSSNNHKPVVPKVHQNGSASKDNTQLKNIGLNKRPPDEERSASVKKPKLSDTVTPVNHKPVMCSHYLFIICFPLFLCTTFTFLFIFFQASLVPFSVRLTQGFCYKTYTINNFFVSIFIKGIQIFKLISNCF